MHSKVTQMFAYEHPCHSVATGGRWNADVRTARRANLGKSPPPKTQRKVRAFLCHEAPEIEESKPRGFHLDIMPKRFRAGEYLELIESYIGNKKVVTDDDGVLTELTVLDLSNMVMYIHELERNCAEQAKALALAEIQHRALEDAAETAMRLATQIRVATRAVHFPEGIVPTVWCPPMTPGESCPAVSDVTLSCSLLTSCAYGRS